MDDLRAFPVSLSQQKEKEWMENSPSPSIDITRPLVRNVFQGR